MNTIPAEFLPVIFLGLMGLSMLLYAILDGFDLGTGLLMLGRTEHQRDQMISSIGPFWDANETWLVLGVGILLVAFPVAHGLILGTLYLPVTLMLAGLILRGVSFDFRAKALAKHKKLWDIAFFVGSLMTTVTQGYMLGLYITGFAQTAQAQLFALLSALCVTGAYTLMGACWLIMKTTDDLQRLAVSAAKRTVPVTALGLVAVSIVNPMVSPEIFQKWLGFPQLFYIAPLPIATLCLFAYLYHWLKRYPNNSHFEQVPFFVTVGIFVLSFIGLAYSFFPMIVPGQLTVWEAASAPDALRIILWGVAFTLPVILLYTGFSYYVFRGKSRALSYT